MESVPDLMHSVLSRWRALPTLQRAVFGIVAAVILAGIFSIGFQSEAMRYVPLSLGKQFSSEELTAIEQSLREQRLTTFRREGNQLLVPENEQTAYDAALLQERQLPQDWASEWEQKFEATTPFTSSRKLRMLKEIALAKELKRIIQGLAGVREANVVWAETEADSWPSRRQKVTASVNIRPEPGYELAEQTIRAIQFSVANMIPNLEPQDVIVLDYSAGRHYQLRPEQARFETDLDRWIDREVSHWHERLMPAIEHHWPGARLLVSPPNEELRQIAWRLMQAVQADRENVPSFHTIEPELQGTFPELMQLTVTLPNDGKREDSPSHPEQSSLEQEVLAALIGWLPNAFDAHQLQVAVESMPADAARLEVAESEATSPSWQPLIMMGAVVFFLLLVSRRFRSSATSSESVLKPVTEQDDSKSRPAPAASAIAAPRAPEPPATPLGDPEVVADVLKHWLGSSRSAGETGPSPAASGETD